MASHSSTSSRAPNFEIASSFLRSIHDDKVLPVVEEEKPSHEHVARDGDTAIALAIAAIEEHIYAASIIGGLLKWFGFSARFPPLSSNAS
jgi:hypothetical protein